MPEDEGRALHDAALRAPGSAPLLEVGSYCGKSAIYLGAAARATRRILYSVDHHRGSEEHQPGEEYHDRELVDPSTGAVDTLACFRRTIHAAGLQDTVIAVVGDSPTIAAHWSTPLSLVFIDGEHSEVAVTADVEGWTPHLAPGGFLALHDVYPEGPSQGGQAPLAVYRRALSSGRFKLEAATGSLRILARTDGG
ncbi:MAG: class I SAM-dependent methyltransferase [Actinomycetota bacterium]